MAVDDPEDAESTLDERYAVTLPPKLRQRLDLEPGNRLRWTVTDDGRLLGEIVREQYGVAEELEPIDIDEETDAVADTEGFAYEVD